MSPKDAYPIPRGRWREEELSRLVEGLKEMGAQKVILFGSWARGEGAEWSDLDILVVMQSDLPFVERMGEVYRRLRPCEADVFVYTPEEMEEGNPVIGRALAEGKVLYEKPDLPAPVLAAGRRANGGKRWLEQAEDDLKKARYNLEGGYCDLVCFLCQQVAEKALKAYFYDKGMEAAWTHSVERLLREAEKQDATFSRLIAAGTSQLDGYYVPTRYPNALPGSIPALVYGRATAEKAIELAEQAVQFVKRKMGQD